MTFLKSSTECKSGKSSGVPYPQEKISGVILPFRAVSRSTIESPMYATSSALRFQSEMIRWAVVGSGFWVSLLMAANLTKKVLREKRLNDLNSVFMGFVGKHGHGKVTLLEFFKEGCYPGNGKSPVFPIL